MQCSATLLFVFALIGAAVAAASPAQAQGRPSVCFYQDTNFQGRAYCIHVGDRVGFVGRDNNDKFSSVRIPPGVAVTMCADANFRGRCITLQRSAANFIPLGFNDIVSAVAAQQQAGGRPPDGRRDWDDRDRHQRDDFRRAGGGGQVCFYEDAGFSGRPYCVPVGASVNWVGDAANDKFSSLRMPPGVEIMVCRDANFQGGCRDFRHDVDFFRGGWNDAISSFRSR